MKKMSWLDNTITWRKYLRLSGICALISAVGTALYWVRLFGNPFSKPNLKIKEQETSVEEDDEN